MDEARARVLVERFPAGGCSGAAGEGAVVEGPRGGVVERGEVLADGIVDRGA